MTDDEKKDLSPEQPKNLPKVEPVLPDWWYLPQVQRVGR